MRGLAQYRAFLNARAIPDYRSRARYYPEDKEFLLEFEPRVVHYEVVGGVADPKGKVTNWACETGNPGALSRRGWKRGDIKLGDKLVVDGYLAKDGSHFIDARRVLLPDGRSVYGGSPGDGGPQEKPAGTRN